jgi:hypothetical protein
MNHLVFLDARAGELERILSGLKTMLIKEFDPAQINAHPVSPGDSLYFLRNHDECALQVKATVTRVLSHTSNSDQDLSHTLKEMQPRLQLTEDQYNGWSAKHHAVLVEFESAHKIGVIRIPSNGIADRSDWIAFEDFSQIGGEEHDLGDRS